MFIGDLKLLIPILGLVGGALVVLLLGVIAEKRPGKGIDHWLPAQHLAPALTLVAVILAGGLVWWTLLASSVTTKAALDDCLVRVPAVSLFTTQGGHAQLMLDPFAAVFGFMTFVGLLVVMVLSLDYYGEKHTHKAEYYALLMLATAASALCAAASDLIVVYLSVEFLSLSSYVLAAFAKSDRRSAEAGLKYFLYGAVASAMMLYGMSVLFGITGGSTTLGAIARGLSPDAASSGAAWVGTVFVLVGLGFKIALVPFHFWAPDTYEGAPTPVTAFLSVVSKAAGLAIIVRFLMVVGSAGASLLAGWYWILVVLTAASMFYGNLVAIPQRNIKRMLAYSSVAQIGYLMIGVLSSVVSLQTIGGSRGSMLVFDPVGRGKPPWDLQGVLIYLFAYLFMNLGAFAVVVAVWRDTGSDAIENYAGLMHRAPFLAASMTVFLVSLAGVPPTAGFVGKLFIFGSAISTGLRGHTELIILAILGVANSVISAFYYLNVVRLMFFAPAMAKPTFLSARSALVASALCLIITLGVIVIARPVSTLATRILFF